MRTVPAVLALLAICQGEEEPQRPSRSFTMVYNAAIEAPPQGARRLRLWMPVPADTQDQKISKATVAVTVGVETASKPLTAIGGLKKVGDVPVNCTVADIRNGWGKSICVESPGKAVKVQLTFDVLRFETSGGGKASKSELKAALEAAEMIPLDGKAAGMASGIEDGSDSRETGRKLYDHTLARMRYDKPAGGDWGRGDADWACDSRHGNCTDFHSYFIALARKKGIPARFEMGFPVAGGTEKERKIGGYHCWAYFWVGDHGWVPVDISEADKHPEKAEYFFGKLDYNRVTMTRGRDLVLTPAPAKGSLNFFVYPYAEADGKEFKEIKKAFKRINSG
jgi:hypothetical protein